MVPAVRLRAALRARRVRQVRAGAGGGRGPAGPPPPPPVTETVDQVLVKYVQALGGQPALQNAKTRVMTGTVTNRDLTTADVTVTEKSTGEARIEIATQPNPTVRATNGTAAWQIGGGGGGGGGFGGGANARDITGFQVQQGFRLADFSLPLNLKQRYQNLSVKPAYETIEGKQVVVLSGNPYPNVTEELSFDRESGLLVRRTVTSGTAGGFGILALGEQIDYGDYRDVSGVKVPLQREALDVECGDEREVHRREDQRARRGYGLRKARASTVVCHPWEERIARSSHVTSCSAIFSSTPLNPGPRSR